ncbi:hypothetical protein BSL78_17296 [Apostichopus japonicus]|uniref:Uncharacterized protein n=1 Tax=Stichopus japonicus TaxID=307972 RepID=A0A2G8KCY2_STIJA|nr:hypothetical protein BSL78_17296 [Apostichopus japonicus]
MLGKRSSEGQRSQSRMSEGQKVKKSSKVMYVGSVQKFMKSKKEDKKDIGIKLPATAAKDHGIDPHELSLAQFRTYSNTYPRFKGNSFLKDRSAKHGSDFPDWRTTQVDEEVKKGRVDNLPVLVHNLHISEENNNKEMLPTQGSENTDANSRADKGDVNRDGDTVIDMNLPDPEHLFKQDYKRSWKDENKQKKKKKTSQDRDNNQSLHRQIKKMRRLATTPTSENFPDPYYNPSRETSRLQPLQNPPSLPPESEREVGLLDKTQLSPTFSTSGGDLSVNHSRSHSRLSSISNITYMT